MNPELSTSGSPNGGRGVARHGLPVLVLLAGLLLTALATIYLARAAEQTAKARFQSDTQRVSTAIDSQTKTYFALLQASRGFFYAAKNVSRDDFKAYISQLDMRQLYPGLQGIGFIARAGPEKLAQLQKDDASFQLTPPGRREEYYVVILLEPRDKRNSAVLGYDMLTEPVRRAAMERARDQDTLAASGKVLLRQEIYDDKQSGFLVYLPLYDTENEPTTVEERRQALGGLVYCPFWAGDFFAVAVSSEMRQTLRVEVFDGPNATPETLLYESAAPPAAPRFTKDLSLEVAGRQWTLRVSSLPAFETATQRGWIPATLAGGTAFSGLLFALFLSQARARAAAEARARALRAAEQAQSAQLAAEQTARQTAEEANRAKDEFLAVVSHELRTPLNAILGWARMLRAGTLAPAGQTRALTIIERNAQTQLRLTEDLLDFAGLHAQQLTLQRRNVAVADVVAAALAAVQPAAAAKGVELVEETDPQAGVANLDAARIQQILWNLLANAVKFTPSGGTVRMRTQRYPERLEFEVSDTGVGIEAEFLPHVFERFRQEDTASTRRTSGLGLGLAIVQDLVALHGGQVEAKSDGKEKGSRFTVSLPLGNGE